MPTTEAKIGYGTTFGFGSEFPVTGSTTYTDIAELNNLAGPGLSVDTPEASNFASPSAVREFIAGMIDGGEISVEGNWLPGNATQGAGAGLIYVLMNRLIRPWRIVFPFSPTVTWILPGIVSGIEPDDPFDDTMTFSATIKVSGVPTLA